MKKNNHEEDEEVCEFCEGTGEVSTDEVDPDSHQVMRGVGTEKCICRMKDPDDYQEDEN